ncbi:MAG TPA: YfhO family protein, partial [Thermoanaerobaculia bacterium]|nr:YfhO family protein [Thermoanaerobaculia bacterium]
AALFYPASSYLTALQREVESGGPWRVAGMGPMLFPSLLSVYGLADVRTHNPLAPMSYLRTLDASLGFAPTTQNYFPPLRHIDHPFLDFLNVRAVTSVESYAPPRTLERIDGGRFGPYRLYRNPDALPRWFLPSAVEVIRQGEVERWIAGLKDPWRVAVFDGRARSWVRERGEVVAALQSPGRMILDVPGRRDRLVATSLTTPRGWRASGGGRRLETVVVNGAFLGVRVPAGVSRIDLRFRPPGFLAGMLLGLAALVMTAGMAWRK